MQKPIKFLLIRFSSIGDIVLTTPVIRCLKQQHPHALIHFLTKKSFSAVLSANPYIDRLHLLDTDWNGLIDELKTESFDQIIDLHHNNKTLRIKNALKKPSHSFYKLNIQKFIYTSLKINVLPDKHIVDRYLETVKDFGVADDNKGLDYFIPDTDVTALKDIPASHHLGYIACMIGAAHGTKRWPVNKWKEFAKRMDHPLILLGGKEDAVNGADIASIDTIKVYNACGKFSLNESADLIKKAKLVITHDTGLMHIAAAFQKPIISLWGNTVPSFGMYPYYGKPDASKKYQIVQVNKLWCRPCSKIGYEKCPLGHFKCMQKIEVDTVLQLVKTWL